ncbi:MAG: thioredoxin [Planctomycetota bacterium]
MNDDAVVIPCPACLCRNRVPRARLADVPVCRDCRTRLLPDHPVALTAAAFAGYTEGGDLPVVIDFWAGWCGPCRMMAPHFEAAARTLAGRALFAKVDTEAEPELARRFGIQGIPCLVVVQRGRELVRQAGAMQAAQIEAWLRPHLG